jgi:hypothetical protein
LDHALRIETDRDARSKLATTIFCRPSTIGDRLATDVLRRELRPGLEGETLTYLSRAPEDPRLQLVGEWHEKAIDRRADASNILATAAFFAPQLLPRLLRLPIWASQLTTAERLTLVGTIEGWVATGLLTQNQVDDSPWAGVFGRVLQFGTKGPGGILSFRDDPEGADQAWIYNKGRIVGQFGKNRPEFAELVAEAKRARE